jgi:protein O-mannosyl-transferase
MIAACGLVCAVIVVFGRVVANDWVDFDDYRHVAKNPVFFPVSWQTLRAVWTPGFERLYVPVSYTVFAGECIASRAVAGGTATSDPPATLFHAMSLALHAAVVMLVFAILRTMVRDQRAAAAGALLFAIHPLQVESVAWAFEQRGLLAAVFSLAAVLLLLRLFRRGTAPGLLSAGYLAATGLLALALLSKPIAVVTPLIAAALLVHLYRPPLKTVAIVLLPWVILAAGTALVTRAVQPAVVVDRNYPWLCRPLIAGDAIAFYAEKIALPVKLCLQYGRTPPAVLADPAAPLRGLCVAMVLGAAFTLPRGSWVRLPLALFLIPLTPVLGLTSFDFQQQSTVADRYVYLAMLGPAAALAVAAEELFESGRWRRLAAIGITAWMAVLGAAAAWQVGVWRDTGTLATQACRVTPRAPWPWILLAAHNLQAGDPLRAAACADRALDLEPGNQNAMFDRAEAAVQLGDAATADSMHTGMLRYGWDNGILVNGLYQRAVAHLRAGRSERAEKCFAAAIGWDSEYVPALVNLGVLCARRAEHGAAEELFRKALAIDPQQVAAWVGLGNSLYDQGRAGEAVECFSKALDIDPADGETLANRAWARVAAGDRRGAEADLAMIRERGFSPDPDLVEAIMRLQPAKDAGGR